MPFVLEDEECWRRPLKRRRLEIDAAMARYLNEDRSLSDHEDRKKENGRPDLRHQEEIRTSDREELIQCIKRGQKPTWVPKPALQALCSEADAEALLVKVLPAATTSETSPRNGPNHEPDEKKSDPIPRPPSALHAGDFGPPKGQVPVPTLTSHHPATNKPFQSYSISPPPWMQDDPFPSMPHAYSHSSTPNSETQRSRAPSLGSSLSSSFVFRTPTSPLVHATSSPASKASDHLISRPSQPIPDMSSRRRTLPSNALMQMSSLISAPSNPLPSVSHETSAPFRAHQVRRSLTSVTYQPAPSSQTIFPSRQRRMSHTTDLSSRRRSSMIGSFEESILRGRMSTPPSKPLDFVAQIGVLGRGDCPARLKCPAHVSVPFPAVYYSYPAANALRTLADDSPSPYVGTIDLESNLKPIEEPQRRRHETSSVTADDLVVQDQLQSQTPRRKFFIGGAYRVPQEGQLQVIVKNPNKTAVKLFLIPYKLDEMQPGTKTFLRQRSFSSGPVLEKPLSTDPERHIVDPLSDKQILRYLIHLKFCCLGKGKFYLYDNIRVVFANRVPEGKEKLRNEVQTPEPRYSTFNPAASSRRQSISDTVSSPRSPAPLELFESLQDMETPSRAAQPLAEFASVPLDFHSQIQRLPAKTLLLDVYKQGEPGNPQADQRDLSSGSSSKTERPQSPEVYGFDRASTSQRGSPVPWSNLGSPISRTTSPTPANNHSDGLLSRKLRELSKQESRNQTT